MVGTWSKLCQERRLSKVVEALDLLVLQGSYVAHSIFYGVLKRCIAQKDLVLGSRIHALVVRRGFESNAYLANHIICMYASHGRLEEATNVFTKVRAPSRHMWASIILAHARHGQPSEAMRLYRQMQESTVKPHGHAFVAALKACAAAKDLSLGREVHTDVLDHGEHINMYVSTSLVDMYSKCGSLEDARKVFDQFPTRDVVMWNAMISAYAQHGFSQEALCLYESMQQQGIALADAVTFVCLLQACAGIKGLHQGKHLHAQIQERGLQADPAVCNGLITMYARCGSLAGAREVFDNLLCKDVVTWTAMIAGYAQSRYCQEALHLYASMQQEAVTAANHVTFVCLLQACASVGSLYEGKQLHAQIQERGLEAKVDVGNCLVHMYAKCGSLEDARRVFDCLPSRDVVTWNTMIAAYAQHGLGEEALSLYASMKEEGMTQANHVTYMCLLRACAGMGAVHRGRQLHAEILRSGLQTGVVVGTCLVDMYAKCGNLEDAHTVFNNLHTRDVVTWNVMIAAYAEHGFGRDAFSLYERMELDRNISADSVTFISLLQACAADAGYDKGKELHAHISKMGLVAADLLVANALIDMYGKCGSMVDAQEVFDILHTRDVVTWNALLAGYARNGESKVVLDLFRTLGQEAIQPNGISFLSVLTACNHAGLIVEGLEYFETMSRNYGINPSVEHYNCVVDLLGRAGQLNQAMEIVSTMPFQPHVDMWKCLLGACRKWRNVKLGKEAFECAVRLDRNDASPYVTMAHIYAAADMWEEAINIQAGRMEAQAWKKPGQSWWIDMDGVVHMFIVEDREHFQMEHTYAKLHHLLTKMRDAPSAAHSCST